MFSISNVLAYIPLTNSSFFLKKKTILSQHNQSILMRAALLRNWSNQNSEKLTFYYKQRPRPSLDPVGLKSSSSKLKQLSLAMWWMESRWLRLWASNSTRTTTSTYTPPLNDVTSQLQLKASVGNVSQEFKPTTPCAAIS